MRMTVEEKRGALEQVLQGRVLQRCDQLKKMLRFICEAEIEGRAAELNEYLIGVEAFGRPASYTPVEDSIVRTRAYELRNKLTRYYGTEAPDAPIQIEIARGAYVPRFIRRQDPSIVSAVPNTEASPGNVLPGARTWVRMSSVAGLIVLALLAYALLRSPKIAAPPRDAWTPEMEAFWKPFLSTNTPLMLTYNSRLFLLALPLDLMVRNWQTNEMSEVPQSAALLQFQKQMGVDRLVETRNYVDFGAMYSVFLLTRTLDRRQSQISLKASKDLAWTDVFNDNIIFVGGMSSADPRLRRVQEAGDFVEHVEGIANLHPKSGELAFYPVAHSSKTGANDGDKYAVLSRFPGPQRGRCVMLIGSAHSELPWALAEYVTNPLSVGELMQHVKLPSGELPEAFQVILRVTLQAQVPVRIRYVTHHVVTASEFPYEPASQNK
jgi:hypothetical protein